MLVVSIILVVFGSGLLLPGCCCIGKPAKPKPVVAAPAPKPAPKPAAPVGECGPYVFSRDYPVQNAVRLEKSMPREVQVNAPFDYVIKVTNLTDMMLTEVVVTENLSKNFKIAGADPAAKRDGDKLVWTIESLGPKDTMNLKVTGSATATGCIGQCAAVSYVVPTCANTKVVEAKLALSKTAPAEVLLCDPIPVRYVVTNAGSGISENVKIVDELPEGLKTADGKNQVVFTAGNLEAGQSRQFLAQLKASKTGKLTNRAVATSASGLKAEATATTIVRQPILTITKQGRETQYLGQSLTYEIVVANKGDGVARNTIVEDTIPADVTALAVSAGGKVSGSKVVWELGNLEPDASRKVSVSYKPTKSGTFKNTAAASAYCSDVKTASATTSVRGIPAILLEVVDIEDPVQVGNNTTYVITATNQGSMAGTNIAITCTLEEEQQYVSSSGATAGSVEGKTIKFAPLASLAPQARATWQVVVKAVKPAHVLFKVSMRSAEFERPVEETESTNLY